MMIHHYDVNLGHLVEVMLLYRKDPLSPAFHNVFFQSASFTLRKYRVRHHLLSASRGQSIFITYLEFFCTGYLSILAHLFADLLNNLYQ
jgi:hypothetical protein